MFYRLRRKRQISRFNKAIAGILDTPPLAVVDGNLCIASMVANHDVPMYLVALKSVYPKLGFGKVAAIIDRDMPQALRDTLSRHVPGIEFVILEDIETGACQRGGTWERLLYCLDRSEREYVIQMDCDTLAAGADLDEVRDCVRQNRAFAMTDGLSLMHLPKAAELAEAMPSNYIGIVTERAFCDYPDAANTRYIRGSSGFAGFAKGGYTRAAITRFHQEMERRVGKVRWREWGTEQCGSNFAIANSPDPCILPYPEYATFSHTVRDGDFKFFHFIGSRRFDDDYFATGARNLIAALMGRSVQPMPNRTPTDDAWPLAFSRCLTPLSAAAYLAWRLAGQRRAVWLRLRAFAEFRGPGYDGPWFQLRPPGTDGNNDGGVAYEIFVHRFLMPPVWIQPETVELVVDLGANVGMSCVFWLAHYWRTEVVAFEPHPAHARQCLTNITRNGFTPRFTLHQAAAGAMPGRALLSDQGSSSHLLGTTGAGHEVDVADIFPLFAGRQIDILKIDIEGSEVALLEDPRFATLDVRVIVMEWHRPQDGKGGKAWCLDRLRALGLRTYVTHDAGDYGMVWAYRRE